MEPMYRGKTIRIDYVTIDGLAQCPTTMLDPSEHMYIGIFRYPDIETLVLKFMLEPGDSCPRGCYYCGNLFRPLGEGMFDYQLYTETSVTQFGPLLDCDHTREMLQNCLDHGYYDIKVYQTLPRG